MPRIKDILRDHILSADDKLLGTDIDGTTRNYRMSDVASFGNLGATGFADITSAAPVSGSAHTHGIDLNTTVNNYNVTAVDAPNKLIFENVNANVVGKTGTIVITNPSSVGSLAWEAFPTSIYTPGGGSISFDATAGKIGVLNYFVASTSVILVNYVGNFGSYPQPS